MPLDDELKARIPQETEGFITWETRVKNFDGEIDIQEEKKRLQEENDKKIEDQQKAFGGYDFKDTQQDTGEDNKNASKGEVDEE